jgi:hypothetical protein
LGLIIRGNDGLSRGHSTSYAKGTFLLNANTGGGETTPFSSSAV